MPVPPCVLSRGRQLDLISCCGVGSAVYLGEQSYAKSKTGLLHASTCGLIPEANRVSSSRGHMMPNVLNTSCEDPDNERGEPRERAGSFQSSRGRDLEDDDIAGPTFRSNRSGFGARQQVLTTTLEWLKSFSSFPRNLRYENANHVTQGLCSPVYKSRLMFLPS